MIKKNTDHSLEKPKLEWADVQLLPLDYTPIEKFYEWQNNPELRDMIMGFRFPIQKSTIRGWLEADKEQNGKTRISFSLVYKSESVGMVSLLSIDSYQRTAKLGVHIAESEARGKGVGFMSCCLLLDYAFRALDFRKVSLEVLSTNNEAVSLYEGIGFIKEGCLRENHFVSGKYLDVLVYGILSDEFTIEIPSTANRQIGFVG